jgi:hypothetical protein
MGVKVAPGNWRFARPSGILLRSYNHGFIPRRLGPRRLNRIVLESDPMPRPSKAIRRTKINAGLDYKRGKRKEAYTAWEKAAAALKERTKAKRNKHKKAEEAANPSAGEAS